MPEAIKQALEQYHHLADRYGKLEALAATLIAHAPDLNPTRLGLLTQALIEEYKLHTQSQAR